MNPYQSPISSQVPLPPQFGKPPTVWPKVIGILCIIFGGFGVLGTLASLLFSSAASELLSKTYSPELLKDYTSMAKLQSALGLVPAVCLLVGGIMLLFRKKIGAILLLVFSALGIGFGIYSTAATFAFQKKAITEVRSHVEANPTMNTTEKEGIMMGQEIANNPAVLLAALLVSCALPTFILVWLLIPRFRREWSAWQN